MASHHLPSECIDAKNGVYTVLKSFQGASTLLHVAYKVWGGNHNVCGESSECQKNMELAWTWFLNILSIHWSANCRNTFWDGEKKMVWWGKEEQLPYSSKPSQSQRCTPFRCLKNCNPSVQEAHFHSWTQSFMVQPTWKSHGCLRHQK